jgi:hypothetical protein
MERSTREFTGPHRRGFAVVALGASVAALGVLGWIVLGSDNPAQAYTVGPPSPAAICSTASEADLSALEQRLQPSDETTLQAGAPVTFSGYSAAPLMFAVASSPALLSSPNVDSGTGSAQPQASGSPLYIFTSTKATATPGTIYWNASFSDATLAECAGLPPTTYTTPTRTLSVLPAPASPPPTPSSTPPPITPAPVSVSIGALSSFHLTHPTVKYSVHCTMSCSGDTDYALLVVPRHGRAVRAPKLGLGPEPVSIAAAAGGDELFTHHYRGSSLHMLTNALRAGDKVELQISVKVTDAYGNAAHAQRTARLPT